MSIKISVVVPVYKVERYVERCVRSLLTQTLADVEYIFVDDCTPDAAMAIIRQTVMKHTLRLDAVRYVHHKQNRGLPVARNSGLAVARGEYVFHCDSDDYIESDMLERMYYAAVQCNADIAYADWFLSFRKNERIMREPVFHQVNDCLKAILCGKMKYNVWNKLVKRSLYEDNRILFPDGLGMGEDMTVIKLFCHARKVVHVDGAFYHYVQMNENAYTKTVSEYSLQQVYANANNAIHYVGQIHGDCFERELQCFKLNVKLPLLISANRANYATWLSWFPEANRYIGADFSLRIRWLQRAALKRWFWLLRLHYYGVMKIIYGVIYR